MRFTYCPTCGALLGERVLGDDGLVPWCAVCQRPWWETFTTSVLCAVTDGRGHIALIRQSYGDTSRFVCVAGIMKPGECAEDAVAREVMEELGLEVRAVRYLRSDPHQQGNMLMLGFCALVERAPFTQSDEVAEAAWFTMEEAQQRLANSHIARKVVADMMKAGLESAWYAEAHGRAPLDTEILR